MRAWTLIMSREHDGGVTAGRRQAVLRTLRQSPGPLGIRDIAGRLSVHPNTVRFHLGTLVKNGQVEQVEADPPTERTTGRPPLLYRPAQGMDPTGPRQFQLLAELLGEGLTGAPDGSARAIEAGRAWGRRRAAMTSEVEAGIADGSGDSVPRLMELLDELGFAPEQRGGGGQRQIGLRHCPFLELAETKSPIVCPVHLGLMQGAMEAWRSPVAVDRLDPFVEPDLCLAHMTPARTAVPRGHPGTGRSGLMAATTRSDELAMSAMNLTAPHLTGRYPLRGRRAEPWA